MLSSPPEGAADDKSPGRRQRRWLWVAVAVLVTLGIGALGLVVAGPSAPPGVATGGDAAPAFRLPDLRDPSASVSLSDFAGRPVVVNFWASWCVPCRKEMPGFETVSERIRDRVSFVGVDHQDARSDALDLLRETRVRYPIGYDPEGKTGAAYGVLGLPTTVFVSADGRILERHPGQISVADLQATVERLFPAE